MTNRERIMAVLNYESYDRLPLVHFGFWTETYQKWVDEGHCSGMELRENGLPSEHELGIALGFDIGWGCRMHTATGMKPGFESKVVKEFPDGTKHVQNSNGVTVLEKPGAGSIPAEISHLLTDRDSWEKEYKHRYEWNEDRVNESWINIGDRSLRYDQGGAELLKENNDENPRGIFCGSLYGHFRDVVGLEGACYMMVDDEELFDEILDTIADICYRNTEMVLEGGAKFDFAHFWEDICFKNGPLIQPDLFAERIGPKYKKITDLLRDHGVSIVSLDCDGCIDALLPVWLENGVNTMFPIEVGTWNASMAPWREKYGKDLLGVGGMDKKVFAFDKAAIDAEVERQKPLVDLGGYIPCPDHRIPPDARWELVVYYCEQMRKAFG